MQFGLTFIVISWRLSIGHGVGVGGASPGSLCACRISYKVLSLNLQSQQIPAPMHSMQFGLTFMVISWRDLVLVMVWGLLVHLRDLSVLVSSPIRS
jgi:hypothetical protein